MQLLIAVLTDDPALGRFEKPSFSQDILMEMLVQGIDNRKIICGRIEKPRPLKEWYGISFHYRTKGVFKIEWPMYELEGWIDLQYLPTTVDILNVSLNGLTGCIDLAVLPDSLTQLLLSGNQFSGSIDLTKLPSRMKKLDISDNKLTGCIDLTNIPSTMLEMNLDNNTFYGETDFSNLPKSLRMLNLTNTKLEGTIYVKPGVDTDIFQVELTKVEVCVSGH
mmetsp:Transcript_6987/g.10593  ORF Transcript_6987/g.10593 Transcript_6987/m.10593 type:complete len:221 (-) Transcript_6987:59-721(-)